VAVQQVVKQVADLNRSSSNLITADHEALTYLLGNQLRKYLRQWITPPDPSVNYNAASGAHHEGTAAWCTKGKKLADWQTSGSLMWIHGKRTYSIVVRVLIATDQFLIAGSGKSILRCVTLRRVLSKPNLYDQQVP
jgi:hypothetical protein